VLRAEDIMARTEVLGIRLSTEEYADLRAKAERCARTPSDLVRQLVRQVDPARMNPGIPSPIVLPGTAQAEPERATAT
jgi:hypothetical protein